jgi:hypothetical protein
LPKKWFLALLSFLLLFIPPKGNEGRIGTRWEKLEPVPYPIRDEGENWLVKVEKMPFSALSFRNNVPNFSRFSIVGQIPG